MPWNWTIDKNLIKQLNEIAGHDQEGSLCYLHTYVPKHHGFWDDFEIKRKNILAIASRYNTITEIGFNAGHSAALMLTANPNLKLTSIDIGRHSYTVPCATVIQNHFPNRLTLIIKDSKKIDRSEIEQSAVVVIDGGHQFEDCLLDLAMCVAYCKAGTLIVVDDYASPQILEAVNRFSSSLKPCTEYISDADQGIFYLI
jgi:predicted O-methyltransferase YrrM